MVPDKIYLGIGPMSGDEPNKRYLYAEWYEEPKVMVENIEYIRKEALLEWAKEHQKGEMQGSYTWACYQIFIDKLDSINGKI